MVLLVTPKEEFDAWCEDYEENDEASEGAKWQLFAKMCNASNPYALAQFERMQRERPVLPRASHTEFTPAADLHDEFVPAITARLSRADAPLSTIGASEERDRPGRDGPPRSDTEYTPDWPMIARSTKDDRGWRCEMCRFRKLFDSLIQVHHIDGDKSDNKPSNLQVLCAKCHGEKHGSPPLWSIGTSEDAKLELLRYRSYGFENGRAPPVDDPVFSDSISGSAASSRRRNLSGGR